MKELMQLVAENPDLPIIAMVHGEVCGDDCSWWFGHCGSAVIAEIGLIGERYYTDREDFMEAYYDNHDEELCEKFGYLPRCCESTVEKGLYTQEQFTANCLAEEKLNAYLSEIANKYMIKAIVLYVGLPEDNIIVEAK